MNSSTLIALPKTENGQACDDRRKQTTDRAFEAGIRWFLEVSRMAIGQAA